MGGLSLARAKKLAVHKMLTAHARASNMGERKLVVVISELCLLESRFVRLNNVSIYF